MPASFAKREFIEAVVQSGHHGIKKLNRRLRIHQRNIDTITRLFRIQHKVYARHWSISKLVDQCELQTTYKQKPSEPSTILIAMCDIESVSQKAGQQETVFTCDQQLYRVTMDIIWKNST